MTLLRRNIAANFLGAIWTAALGIALVPAYIHFLGVPAYGLIGFFITLQTLMATFDLGLSTTFNREVARQVAGESSTSTIRALLRRVEVIYWTLGASIGTLIWFAAPMIAERWLRSSVIPAEAVLLSVRLMALALAVHFSSTLYTAGLLGLQRHATVNAISIIVGTIRAVGAVAVIALVPSIPAFFAWQAVVSLALTAVTAFFLKRNLPEAQPPESSRPQEFRQVWAFAAGITGIGIAGGLVSQLDKLAVSRFVDLSTFAGYMAAATLVTGMGIVVMPVFNSVFPRFSELIAREDERELSLTYHRASQLVSAALLPGAAILAMLPGEILMLWTGDRGLSSLGAAFVPLLVIAGATNGVLHVPYALQLASGWTRLALTMNVVGVLLAGPAMIWAAWRFGGVGAASVWALLNLSFLALGVQKMHTRLLSGEKGKWLLLDVAVPLAVAVIGGLTARQFFPDASNAPLRLAYLGSMAVAGTAICFAILPVGREFLNSLGRKMGQRT